MRSGVTWGLIPARAGKTSGSRGSAPPGRAHPRAGGENDDPRVRRETEQGLIPARAGKTPPVGYPACLAAAHPRAGGENWMPSHRRPAPAGSSPRGRGKPFRAVCTAFKGGLIPARAGKTVADAARASRWWAHPRAGGENVGRDCDKRGDEGSSPRGRGKRISEIADCTQSGLIPARAGKTPTKQASRSRARAHPRAGGENPRTPFFLSSRQGSSPRGRGKLVVPR